MQRLLALCLTLLTGTAMAGIPVVGGSVDIEGQIEQLMTMPEFAQAWPDIAAAYAEKARQREADAYNRKKAEDLKRVQAMAAAHRTPAAVKPAAERPSAQ
jgi:hypothetical protein